MNQAEATPGATHDFTNYTPIKWTGQNSDYFYVTVVFKNKSNEEEMY